MGVANVDAHPAPSARSRRRLLPWAAGALSLVATVLVILWAQVLFEHDRSVTEDRHAATITGSVDGEMARYADVLRATNALFASSTDVEPGEFESFVTGLSLDARYPGAQTIIDADHADGKLVVEMVAPTAAARYEPGTDLDQLPAVRDAVDRAEQTGAVTMTEPMTGPAGEADVFIIQPDPSGRWLLTRVSVPPLLTHIVRESQSTSDLISITDVSGPTPAVVATAVPAELPDVAPIIVDEPIYGRTWQLSIAHPVDGSGTGRLVTLGLLGMGIAASVVVITALIGLTRSSRRSLALADQASISEERRRRLVDLAPVAITEISADGIVLHANAATEALLGPRSAIEGGPLDITVLSDGPPTMTDWLDDLDGVPLRIRTFTGEHDVVAYATSVTAGADAARLLVVIDETSRRHLEERLAEAEKMEALGLLAGGVAHDFNNLLMPIQGFIELVLLNESLDPEDRDALAEAHAACKRAAALVEQLLTTSRPEVGSSAPVDVVTWLRAADSLLRSMLSPGVELDLRLPPEPGRDPGRDPDGAHEGAAVVRCDATRFEQIVVNLVVNARDSMTDGGLVSVQLTHEGDHVILTVRDQGEGIDDATRSRIFEPFFTTKARRGGTGLGLATVYSTVVNAGGDITVDSTPGEGSTFVVRLPLLGTEVPNPFAPPPPPARLPADDHWPTILLVDDEEYARQLLRQILDDEPYHLLIAGSAEDAFDLALAHDGPLDLVVTDVVLGGRSGPDLVDGLRERLSELPAIFVSGYVDDQFGPEGSLPPNSWFLAKPFRIDDLRAIVRLALSVSSTQV